VATVRPVHELPTGSLTELLTLEKIEEDLFRASYVFPDPFPLYGGQVLAQALLAAGMTVPTDRQPHSLHGYFLRAGDATRPTIFRVDRDRDGRSYSGRRVVAVQNGEVILNMVCSFHVQEDGPDLQVQTMPEVGQPDDLPEMRLFRLFSMEARDPGQPHPGGTWPTRSWSRCTEPLADDPLLHAAVLTYLSDINTGLSPLSTQDAHSSSSLDHAMWFHRPLQMDDWVLMDLVPGTVAAGRGMYTGALYDRAGRLGASIAQETLFRRRRR
jgi:acyl-CoA thioesterase-2